MIKLFDKIEDIKEICRKEQKKGNTVGFVPTMGALHDGHLSLVKKAKDCSDFVVVSIFVNPIQFGPSEDFGKYPRNLDRDTALLESVGADAVFTPDVKTIYTDDFSTYVDVECLTENLCGKSRPGHFRGVTTVVCKFFNIVRPDFAVFGEKDAQQLAVIKKMVLDLNMDVKIIEAPIFREPDGLAMSSRNAYLSREERKEATIIYKSLCEAQKLTVSKDFSALKIVEVIKSTLNKSPFIEIEYIEAVNPLTLKPLDDFSETALIAVAVKIGKTRLIDNITVSIRRNTNAG